MFKSLVILAGLLAVVSSLNITCYSNNQAAATDCQNIDLTSLLGFADEGFRVNSGEEGSCSFYAQGSDDFYNDYSTWVSFIQEAVDKCTVNGQLRAFMGHDDSYLCLSNSEDGCDSDAE